MILSARSDVLGKMIGGLIKDVVVDRAGGKGKVLRAQITEWEGSKLQGDDELEEENPVTRGLLRSFSLNCLFWLPIFSWWFAFFLLIFGVITLSYLSWEYSCLGNRMRRWKRWEFKSENLNLSLKEMVCRSGMKMKFTDFLKSKKFCDQGVGWVVHMNQRSFMGKLGFCWNRVCKMSAKVLVRFKSGKLGRSWETENLACSSQPDEMHLNGERFASRWKHHGPDRKWSPTKRYKEAGFIAPWAWDGKINHFYLKDML